MRIHILYKSIIRSSDHKRTHTQTHIHLLCVNRFDVYLDYIYVYESNIYMYIYTYIYININT